MKYDCFCVKIEVYNYGDTYCTRPGIWDATFILYPPMVHTLFVSIRAIENSPDICHAVHTNCRALEDRAEKEDGLIWILYKPLKCMLSSKLTNFTEYNRVWINPTNES